MPGLILVVEGDGDKLAMPALVNRLLAESGHVLWHVDSRRTKTVGQIGTLRKCLGDYVEYLRAERPGAVLFVVDLDDECPKRAAYEIAARVREAQLPFPVAVVFAKCEYEAWLLASIETVSADPVRFEEALSYPDDPDERRGAKEWIQHRTRPAYDPPRDQKAFTARIDSALAHERSRSFRRLCHALDELVASEAGTVTPTDPRP